MKTCFVLSDALPERPFGPEELVYQTAYDFCPSIGEKPMGLPFFRQPFVAQAKRILSRGAPKPIRLNLCRLAPESIALFEGPIPKEKLEGLIRLFPKGSTIGFNLSQEISWNGVWRVLVAETQSKVASSAFLSALNVKAFKRYGVLRLMSPDTIRSVDAPLFKKDSLMERIPLSTREPTAAKTMEGKRLPQSEKELARDYDFEKLVRNGTGGSLWVKTYLGRNGKDRLYVKRAKSYYGMLEEYMGLAAARGIGLSVPDASLIFMRSERAPVLVTRELPGQTVFAAFHQGTPFGRFALMRRAEAAKIKSFLIGHDDCSSNFGNFIVCGEKISLVEAGGSLRASPYGQERYFSSGIRGIRMELAGGYGYLTLDEKKEAVREVITNFSAFEKEVETARQEIIRADQNGSFSRHYAADVVGREIVETVKSKARKALSFLENFDQILQEERKRFHEPKRLHMQVPAKSPIP